MRISYSIHRFLNRLGPYQSLLILAVPLAIVEPLKLAALFVVGEGHFISGVLVMICAYAGSLFVTERLFVVLKPKLLTLSWYAFVWRWFVTVRDELIYWLRRMGTRLRRNAPRPRGNTETGFNFGWQKPYRPSLDVGRIQRKWKIEPCQTIR